jgi:hypothetical protein
MCCISEAIFSSSNVLMHVRINSYLKCRIIFGKALKNIGFIKCIVGGSSNETVRERCFFALVRSYLECATSIWDPEQNDLIKELDRIQRKAARSVKNYYGQTEKVLNLLEELKTITD